jgi:voltage-gated potassium channel Kch
MPRLAREGSFLRSRTQRAVLNRRVFPYLALTTLGVGVLAGFVSTLVDRKDFPTFGTGIWWAIVTLGTVGYGDVVPHTAWGRVLGVVVIVFGVTFISFLTAVVTSMFVSAEQQQQRELAEERRVAAEDEARALLRDLSDRLGSIEAKLDRRG